MMHWTKFVVGKMERKERIRKYTEQYYYYYFVLIMVGEWGKVTAFIYCKPRGMLSLRRFL